MEVWIVLLTAGLGIAMLASIGALVALILFHSYRPRRPSHTAVESCTQLVNTVDDPKVPIRDDHAYLICPQGGEASEGGDHLDLSASLAEKLEYREKMFLPSTSDAGMQISRESFVCLAEGDGGLCKFKERRPKMPRDVTEIPSTYLQPDEIQQILQLYQQQKNLISRTASNISIHFDYRKLSLTSSRDINKDYRVPPVQPTVHELDRRLLQTEWCHGRHWRPAAENSSYLTSADSIERRTARKNNAIYSPIGLSTGQSSPQMQSKQEFTLPSSIPSQQFKDTQMWKAATLIESQRTNPSKHLK